MMKLYNTTTSFAVGDIVKALSGRDGGRIFAVTQIIDENYVFIANGRSRPLSKPKRKKIKHLKAVCQDGRQAKLPNEVLALTGNLTDKILWREISPFTEK